MNKTLGLQTRLIHLSAREDETASVASPIFQTSNFTMKTPEIAQAVSSEPMPTWYYTRYGSPNARELEPLLADLAGAEAALLVGSGMAAISLAVLANVQQGDHIVAQSSHYSATYTLFKDVLPRHGVAVTMVDQTNPDAFAGAARPNTKVVYTETPTNPTLALTDLKTTAAIAHSIGAVAITDNTFATSINQQPITHGYDLVCESATKFMGGHSDVTAGVIMGRSELVRACWEQLRVYGSIIHPMEAWLLGRGLLTFGVRMSRHNENALTVARFLDTHAKVEKTNYPGLPSHPDHALASRQMPGGFGGVLSFEVQGGRERARTVAASTKVCLMASSLGGVQTLINHPATMVFGHRTESEILELGVAPGLLRLSVGIEDAEDIIADLSAALA